MHDPTPRSDAARAGAPPSPNSLTPPVTNAAFEVDYRQVRRAFRAGGRAGRTRETREVIHDVTLTVRPGEVVAVLGASGCGKSTLLRITAGLDLPSGGTVRIDGTPVDGIDARCALAFQEPRLLPWRSIADNVALGLPLGTPSEAGRGRVAELLELVGLGSFSRHRPREVSGGMAQRASLARALARNPGVLLLDEPFGALDALTRLRMQDLLVDVLAAAPTTVLLVTHDVDEAVQLADRVVVLGATAEDRGATIREELDVPGSRPRNRGSAELAELRAYLLRALGIDPHTH